MPLIKALGRQSRQISEFEASLVYRMSSRTARATQRNPVSRGEKKQNQKQARALDLCSQPFRICSRLHEAPIPSQNYTKTWHLQEASLTLPPQL